MVAASLLPVMVTLMVCVSVPSRALTVRMSCTTCAGGQRLHVARAVVERVAPRAGQRVEGEAAIGSGQRGRDLEVVLGAVDVGNAERAGRGQVPSSVTAPVAVPEMVAASLLPVMVTLMVWVSVPSSGLTARCRARSGRR